MVYLQKETIVFQWPSILAHTHMYTSNTITRKNYYAPSTKELLFPNAQLYSVYISTFTMIINQM